MGLTIAMIDDEDPLAEIKQRIEDAKRDRYAQYPVFSALEVEELLRMVSASCPTFGSLLVGTYFRRLGEPHEDYWEKKTETMAEYVPGVEQEEIDAQEPVIPLA